MGMLEAKEPSFQSLREVLNDRLLNIEHKYRVRFT